MSSESNEVVIVLVLVLAFILLAAGGFGFYQFRSQRLAVERAMVAEREARLMAERAAEAAQRAKENRESRGPEKSSSADSLEDPDWERLSEVWPSLDEEVKARIMDLAIGQD